LLAVAAFACLRLCNVPAMGVPTALETSSSSSAGQNTLQKALFSVAELGASGAYLQMVWKHYSAASDWRVLYLAWTRKGDAGHTVLLRDIPGTVHGTLVAKIAGVRIWCRRCLQSLRRLEVLKRCASSASPTAACSMHAGLDPLANELNTQAHKRPAPLALCWANAANCAMLMHDTISCKLCIW